MFLTRPAVGRAAMIAAALLCVSCVTEEGSTYAGDELVAIYGACEQRGASPTACTSECILAGLNAECPESEGIYGTPEMGAYLDCIEGCATVRTCDGGRILRDCACQRDCAAQGPAHFQGLLAFDADCQRALPECR